MILIAIRILITVVVGAIVFWFIDRYVRDRRLANLLKLLVILVCLAAILERLLPMLGISF
jgi:type III secretory pathway component EscS